MGWFVNSDHEIKKIKHLNRVLMALRDVGRLLVTQNDKQELINGICSILVQKRGYYNAWIGLLDADNNVRMIAESGFANHFDKMRKKLINREFTRCIQKTLESEDVFCVANPVTECTECMLSKKYSGRASMAVRLTHENKNYGFMVLSIPQELNKYTIEKNIVKEISDDIAFGLYRIDLEEKRKLSEKAEKESRIRFKTLIENSLNCICILQNDKKVYESSGPRMIHRISISAFEPPDFENIYVDDQNRIKKKYQDLIANKIRHIETDYRYYPKGDGEQESQIRWALISAQKINYMGIESVIINAMDITDSKESEHFLRIQDKMASLGRVTAGIAHEIRNPLSGIYIYLKALKHIYKNMGDINNILSIIDKVELASNKIEYIIKRVMDFSKPGKPQFVMSNINKNIDEIIKLTSVSLRKDEIKFIKKLDPDLPECWNEPHLIEQVLLNLITNAAEAMKEYDGNKIITVETYQKEDCIVISIKDSGPGIPMSSLSKIFDPFYTTKINSSGIGLSICHRIITDHGGTLRVNSGTQKGALFIIELPLKREGIQL